MFVFYGGEAVPFTGNAITDPVTKGGIWHGREHVFRSTNWGRNPILTKETHRLHCNVWTGDGDVDNNGTYDPPVDLCDDFKPLGDPGPNGRLTSPAYGADRIVAGNHVAALERAYSDKSTLWAATSTGRIFISKNANDPDPTLVVFRRIDTPNSPPRYPTAIFVDRKNPNRAWITYSGYNAKTPTTPGHIFEVVYNPATTTATFTNRDGSGDLRLRRHPRQLDRGDQSRDPVRRQRLRSGRELPALRFLAARRSRPPEHGRARPDLRAGEAGHLRRHPRPGRLEAQAGIG